MRFRKLRIAWSVGCTITCMLLVALWVRSYRYADDLVITLTKTRQLELQSVPGRCIAFIAYAPSRPISSFIRYMNTKPQGAEHAHLKHGVLGDEWAMSTIWVAHWILATVLLLLALAPWARYLRFSLRTLLIATTLVAVLLGLIAAATRQ
jgi:hypothetical protein